MADRFAGHDGRECGEHRTTGHRAWCFDDSEWCYPESPCRGCELPSLRQRAERAEAAVQRVRDLAEAANAAAEASASRQLGGTPFPASVPTADILAALDQPEETTDAAQAT